jgi:SAM-dependent methyltransferase
MRAATTDQRSQWSESFAANTHFFGEDPSDFAREALALFREENVHRVLELGFGQGRDTFLFARAGLHVTAVDYSSTAIETVATEAEGQGLEGRLHAEVHDIRDPLPFPDESFDACYSHMLLCMELSTAQIAFALKEMHRVLRPGGVLLYTVRSIEDKHYRSGTHLGENLYQVGDFAVHFFSQGMIRRLAVGFDMLSLHELEEGSLPRHLYVAVMRKDPKVVPPTIDPEALMARTSARPMDVFQEFFDATQDSDVLDGKTKALVFLAASLGGGCDP